jgi:hypothetical protein
MGFQIKTIVPVLVVMFIFSTVCSQLKSGVAINLYVGHSDSVVIANVKVNNNPVEFDTSRKQYIIMTNQLKRNNNVLTISKPGFAPERVDIDSIFRDYRLTTDLPVSIALKHHWDTTYLQQGVAVHGFAHPQYIMLINAKDSAKVFKHIKGRNLLVAKMYNYCNGYREHTAEISYPADTYIFMHCYGAAIRKQNSEDLRYLRSIFGDDNAGPVVLDGIFPKVLTHRLELRFVPGTSEARRKEILDQFKLTIYYRDGYSPGVYVVEADRGTGDHIIGIAHRLQQYKEVAMVSNILNALVCTTK